MLLLLLCSFLWGHRFGEPPLAPTPTRWYPLAQPNQTLQQAVQRSAG